MRRNTTKTQSLSMDKIKRDVIQQLDMIISWLSDIGSQNDPNKKYCVNIINSHIDFINTCTEITTLYYVLESIRDVLKSDEYRNAFKVLRSTGITKTEYTIYSYEHQLDITLRKLNEYINKIIEIGADSSTSDSNEQIKIKINSKLSDVLNLKRTNDELNNEIKNLKETNEKLSKTMIENIDLMTREKLNELNKNLSDENLELKNRINDLKNVQIENNKLIWLNKDLGKQVMELNQRIITLVDVSKNFNKYNNRIKELDQKNKDLDQKYKSLEDEYSRAKLQITVRNLELEEENKSLKIKLETANRLLNEQHSGDINYSGNPPILQNINYNSKQPILQNSNIAYNQAILQQYNIAVANAQTQLQQLYTEASRVKNNIDIMEFNLSNMKPFIIRGEVDTIEKFKNLLGQATIPEYRAILVFSFLSDSFRANNLPNALRQLQSFLTNERFTLWFTNDMIDEYISEELRHCGFWEKIFNILNVRNINKDNVRFIDEVNVPN